MNLAMQLIGVKKIVLLLFHFAFWNYKINHYFLLTLIFTKNKCEEKNTTSNILNFFVLLT